MSLWYDRAQEVGARCATTPAWQTLTDHLHAAEAQLTTANEQLRTLLSEQVRPAASGTAWIASRVEPLPPELTTSTDQTGPAPHAPDPDPDPFMGQLEQIAETWKDWVWWDGQDQDQAPGPAAPTFPGNCCPTG